MSISQWFKAACAVACATTGILAEAKPVSVGLLLDKGGKDDKSFNAAAYEGLMRAEKEFGVKSKIVEAPDDNALEQLLLKFANSGKYDLIIGVGFIQKDAIDKVSAKYPKIKFALVDAEVERANVRSILFQEHEGSFLVGAIAGLMSKTGKIGFVGGMDIPLIRRFERGYEAGAKHVNPKVEVFQNYVGVTGDAWKNPGKGKELAKAQYARNADIVFAAAGASGLGVFDAAEETKKFAIGVDSNQNWVKPGLVLTSMLKRVDVGVYQVTKDVVQGTFTAGTKRHGLADKGVDYAMDEHNSKLIPKDVLNKVEAIRADILAGKIQVPDYYNESK